jgi:hypothetical protein
MSKEKIILRFDIPCSKFDIQSAKSRGRQGYVSPINGAFATSCGAPGLYGKKKLPQPLNSILCNNISGKNLCSDLVKNSLTPELSVDRK